MPKVLKKKVIFNHRILIVPRLLVQSPKCGIEETHIIVLKLFRFRLGLRKVYPYYFTFTTFTKGRWVNQNILDVFAREFRAHPAEEYVSTYLYYIILYLPSVEWRTWNFYRGFLVWYFTLPCSSITWWSRIHCHNNFIFDFLSYSHY